MAKNDLNPEMARMLRRCQRTIRLVSELHKNGYQGLRIYPYQGGLGAWRLEVHPYSHFSTKNSLVLMEDIRSKISSANYTAAADNLFFGWKDAKSDTARDLAKKFQLRFSNLCHYSKGRDWEYAGWLQELMGFLEADNRLPCLIWEYMEDSLKDFSVSNPNFLPIKKFKLDGSFEYETSFPLPPNLNFHSLS